MLSTVKLYKLIGVSAVSNVPKRSVLVFSHLTVLVVELQYLLNAPTMYHVS